MAVPDTTDADGTADHAVVAERPPPRRSFLAELPVLVIVAFVLALVLKTFLVQAFYIPSESMQPTLEVGDRVLVNKLAYSVRDPRRGEVVVFREDPPEGVPDTRGIGERALDFVSSGLGAAPTERDFIKRIIGLPGDVVEMHDGVVTVNGQPLPEAPAAEGGYLLSRDPSDYGPYTVPGDAYFMMGDNRLNSADSRFPSLGTIERDDLLGRAFVVIWPVPRAGTLPIADYPGVAASAGAPSQQ